MAKRYYEYFTGFQADITDLNGYQLSADDQLHRKKVISLGVALKAHKNVKQLIGDILESSEYQKSVEGE
jgi:hypothetical protein